MTDLALCLGALFGALAVLVWVGPYIANKVLLLAMWWLNRRIAKFNRRRAERNAKIRSALDQLQAYVSTRDQA